MDSYNGFCPCAWTLKINLNKRDMIQLQRENTPLRMAMYEWAQ